MFLYFLYFATRLINLGNLPLFNDEAFFIYAIRKIISDPVTNLFINFSDGKEPLFFWLYTLPVKFSPDALLGIRIFTVLLGFLTLIYLQKIAKKLTINSFWVGLAFIVSPFLLFYHRIAMQETLLTFLLVASTYYLLKNQKFLSGIFLGLSLLTKTSSLAFLVPLLIIKRNKISLLIAGIIFLPALLGFTQITNHNSGYFGIISFSQIIINLKMAVRWLWEYQGPIGLLGILMPPVILESFVAKIFFPRYFLFVIPFVILLAVKIFQKRPWILLLLLIPNFYLSSQIIFNLPNAPLPYIERWQYLEAWPAGYGIKDTADYLKSQNIKSMMTEDIMITKYGLLYYYQELNTSDPKSNIFVFKKSKEIASEMGLVKLYNSFDVSVYRSYVGSQ